MLRGTTTANRITSLYKHPPLCAYWASALRLHPNAVCIGLKIAPRFRTSPCCTNHRVLVLSECSCSTLLCSSLASHFSRPVLAVCIGSKKGWLEKILGKVCDWKKVIINLEGNDVAVIYIAICTYIHNILSSNNFSFMPSKLDLFQCVCISVWSDLRRCSSRTPHLLTTFDQDV